MNPFRRIQKLTQVDPPLETGEGTPLGTLRAKIYQSSYGAFEWWAEIEIFEKDPHYYPFHSRWMGWDYWARDVAASKFKWRRGEWPDTVDDDVTEEGARVKACAMLKAVREFQPLFVKDPEYMTEEDCK